MTVSARGFDRPRLQVKVGGRDISERCDGLTFSATDPGGFEIATLGMPQGDLARKGEAVTIRSGLEVAWWGRVAEISEHSDAVRATKTLGCEGARALLRDTLVQEVYVDHDLTQWGADSRQWQIDLLSGVVNGFLYNLGSFSVVPDTASGDPAVALQIDGAWDSSTFPLADAWYDIGVGNIIGKLFYYNISNNVGLGSGGWQGTVMMSVDDVASANVQHNLSNGEQGYFAPGAFRYATVFLTNTLRPGGQAGFTYNCALVLAVFGDHGLTIRGAGAGVPGGFWPSDIARHVLGQVVGVDSGVILDASSFVVPHAVYRSPTPADTVIDDMAKLMGWTWGVWEPATIFGFRPRLDFRPPPTDATAVVLKAECNQLDITSRLGDLYDTAQVRYTDQAGKAGIATVTLPNPALYEAGVAGRTLPLDMGVASAAAATSFGQFALALSQTSARAAGQATLPASVRLPYGGHKPAHLLRPGIDRLRIIDLTDGGSLTDVGLARRDTFRISRIETTVAKDGTPSTRVELDSGSNLLETLQARLSLAAGVVGAGASGG